MYFHIKITINYRTFAGYYMAYFFLNFLFFLSEILNSINSELYSLRHELVNKRLIKIHKVQEFSLQTKFL